MKHAKGAPMMLVESMARNDDEGTSGSELDALVGEARELLERQRQLHTDMVEDGPAGSVEKDLLDLLTQRRELERQLGRIIIRGLALGGHLELSFPEEPQEKVREPEEPQEKVGEPEVEVGEIIKSEVEEIKSEVEEIIEPESVTEEPVSKAATQAQLQALVSNGLTPNWKDSRRTKARLLRRLFRTLDKPGRLKTRGAVDRAVHSLCIAGGRAASWLELPRPVQKQIIGLLASMARHVQDECKQPMGEEATRDLRVLFSALTRWSAEHRPGFVPGLSRHNEPEWGETWLDDAKHWWGALREELYGPGVDDEVSPEEALSELEDDLKQTGLDKGLLQRAVKSVLTAGVSPSDKRLTRLLVPHYELLKGARISKTLKSNVRQAVRSTDDETDDLDDTAPIPEAVLTLTRGRVAAIAGGDPRQHAQQRIQARFGFSDVLWDPAEPRRIQSLLTRIQAGSIDVLFVLRRFIGHTAFSDLCAAGNAAGITVCMIDHGYGVTQLRLALEAKAES